jgi:lysophospholipase L1-like esterase
MSRESVKHHFGMAVRMVILIEVILQMYVAFRYLGSTWQQKRINDDIVARTWALKDPRFNAINDEESSVFEQYVPFVGWKTRAYQTAHMNVDADGIRRTVGNPEKSDISLYLFGGSAMWGEGHADETTIPSLIASSVNQKSPGIAVTNYGEIGYGSTQEVIKLALLLKSGKRPNHVVFYDGCNDFFLATLDSVPHQTFRDTSMASALGNIWVLPDDGKNAPVGNPTVLSKEFWQNLWRGIATYVQVVRYASMIIDTRTHQNAPINTPVTTIGDTDRYTMYIVTNYKENMKLVDALAKEYGFDYVSFWQPTVYSRKMSSDEQKLPDLRIDQYDKLSKIYKDSGKLLEQQLGATFVDLSGIYTGINNSVFTDTCHVTIQGNTLVSEAMSGKMKSVWGIE